MNPSPYNLEDSDVIETPTIRWQGASGNSYRYWIYPIGHSLKTEGGNYIFARETESGRYTPIYIGETGDLSDRFDNHHKAECIGNEGATHIHARLNSKHQDRLDEEADLVAKWQPPCND